METERSGPVWWSMVSTKFAGSASGKLGSSFSFCGDIRFVFRCSWATLLQHSVESSAGCHNNFRLAAQKVYQKSTLEDELKAELEEVIKAVAQQAAEAAQRVNSLQSACKEAELDARRQLEERKAKLTQRLSQEEQKLFAGTRLAGQQGQHRPASARVQRHDRERSNADLRANHTNDSERPEVTQAARVENTGASVDGEEEVPIYQTMMQSARTLRIMLT